MAEVVVNPSNAQTPTRSAKVPINSWQRSATAKPFARLSDAPTLHGRR